MCGGFLVAAQPAGKAARRRRAVGGDSAAYHGTHGPGRYCRRAVAPLAHIAVTHGHGGARADDDGSRRRRRPASNHGFRGVHQRAYGRWASEIRDRTRGHRIWIGTYDTAEAAARAYDAEARRIHGGKARTNFPIQQEAAADKKLNRAPAAEIVAPAAAAALHVDDWPLNMDIETYVEPAVQLVTPASAAHEDNGTWDLEAYMKHLSEVELEDGADQPPPPPPPPQQHGYGCRLDYLLLMMCN